MLNVEQESRMTTKPEGIRPGKPGAEGSTRGGHLGPTKGKQDRPRSAEETLDDALEQSFPASDPPAQTEPTTHVGAKRKHEKKPN
jgi:hypothetical protein